MNKKNAAYAAILSLRAEMIWDEVLRKSQEERLYKEIDNALARGDAVSFIALTDELKSL